MLSVDLNLAVDQALTKVKEVSNSMSEGLNASLQEGLNTAGLGRMTLLATQIDAKWESIARNMETGTLDANRGQEQLSLLEDLEDALKKRITVEEEIKVLSAERANAEAANDMELMTVISENLRFREDAQRNLTGVIKSMDNEAAMSGLDTSQTIQAASRQMYEKISGYQDESLEQTRENISEKKSLWDSLTETIENGWKKALAFIGAAIGIHKLQQALSELLGKSREMTISAFEMAEGIEGAKSNGRGLRDVFFGIRDGIIGIDEADAQGIFTGLRQAGIDTTDGLAEMGRELGSLTALGLEFDAKSARTVGRLQQLGLESGNFGDSMTGLIASVGDDAPELMDNILNAALASGKTGEELDSFVANMAESVGSAGRAMKEMGLDMAVVMKQTDALTKLDPTGLDNAMKSTFANFKQAAADGDITGMTVHLADLASNMDVNSEFAGTMANQLGMTATEMQHLANNGGDLEAILAENSDRFKENADRAAATAEANANLSGQWEGLTKSVMMLFHTVMKPFAAFLDDSVAPLLGTIAGWIDEISGNISDFMAGNGNYADFWQSVAIGMAAVAAVILVVAVGFKLLGAAIAIGGTAAAAGLGAVLVPALGIAAAILAIGAAVYMVGKGITPVIEAITGLVTGMIDSIIGGVEMIGSTVGLVIDSVGEIITAIANSIDTVVSSVAGGMGSVMDSTMTALERFEDTRSGQFVLTIAEKGLDVMLSTFDRIARFTGGDDSNTTSETLPARTFDSSEYTANADSSIEELLVELRDLAMSSYDVHKQTAENTEASARKLKEMVDVNLLDKLRG